MIKEWKFFSENELKCKGTGELDMDEEFMEKLVAIREKLNLPMTITSGYRSKEHNEAIGGAKNSPHIYGKAVDIACHGEKAYKIVQLALEAGFTGIGVKQKGAHGARFIHIDTMEVGPLVPRPWIWSY